MNKTLALHFETDYLLAGIEPLTGKFQQITKRGMNEFPFYFMIDKISNKIDYSFDYKDDYEKKFKNKATSNQSNVRIVGDFTERITDTSDFYQYRDYQVDIIELLLPVLDDIRESYIARMKKISDIDYNQKIPVAISFSDNIKPPNRVVIKQYIAKQNFEIAFDDFTLPGLLVDYFIEKEHLHCNDKNYAVVEALGNNLNISIVKIYNEYDRERCELQSFHDFGVDPRVKVLAERIVDDINRQEGLLSTDADKKREYKRQYPVARHYLKQLENQSTPYLIIQTTFAADPERKHNINLDVQSIERETGMFIRQISRSFENVVNKAGLQTGNLERIFLLGNTLNNKLVQQEFSRFGNEKLQFIENKMLSVLLVALLLPSREKQSSYSAAESMQETSNHREYKTIEFVTVAKLKPKTKIKILNHDPTPGKGDSMQEMQYLGDNKFLVINSTRSLQAGDIAIAITAVWTAGIQVDLKIERGGKTLGQFRTRPVKKIEVQ